MSDDPDVAARSWSGISIVHQSRPVITPIGKGRDGPSAGPALQSGKRKLDYEMEWEYTIHWIRSRGEPTGFHKQIYLPDALILYGRHAATVIPFDVVGNSRIFQFSNYFGK